MEKNIKFKDWLAIASMSRDMDGFMKKMNTFSRPFEVAGKRTQENLNDMTVGQMLQLSGMKSGGDLFYKTTEVLLGLDEAQTAKALAVEVVSYVGWVIGQIERINRLFDKAKGKPTDKELRAGINRLKFGMFGLVDWYAQRMGITNHDDVMGISWMRLYKCMDIDNRTNEFNRRMANIK